jgi:hypothetical protein
VVEFVESLPRAEFFIRTGWAESTLKIGIKRSLASSVITRSYFH